MVISKSIYYKIYIKCNTKPFLERLVSKVNRQNESETASSGLLLSSQSSRAAATALEVYPKFRQMALESGVIKSCCYSLIEVYTKFR